ncbi:hypothetical protein LDENG_00084890 [Lucifuga dentata]|nr:hypothetical protein LDENG_00084890 [Lucifuga dentata]
MNLLRAAAVFLALLCVLILAAMIGLGIQSIQDQTSWSIKTNKLLLNNMDLTAERDELQWNNSKLKRNVYKHSQEIHMLQMDRQQLTVTISNLINERQEFVKQVLEKARCSDEWLRFDDGCYFFSNSTKNWNASRYDCESKNAQLVIISSLREEIFISAIIGTTWIGLTDIETEHEWKWVDGTIPNETYWGKGEPNNAGNKEHCAVNLKENWNDLSCALVRKWVCKRKIY